MKCLSLKKGACIGNFALPCVVNVLSVEPGVLILSVSEGASIHLFLSHIFSLS